MSLYQENPKCEFCKETIKGWIVIPYHERCKSIIARMKLEQSKIWQELQNIPSREYKAELQRIRVRERKRE